jgi:hypothetical protein
MFSVVYDDNVVTTFKAYALKSPLRFAATVCASSSKGFLVILAIFLFPWEGLQFDYRSAVSDIK